jgi:hypothetical protein
MWRANLSAYARARRDASLSERLARLGALLEANGIPRKRDDASLQRLNDWFVAAIEPHPIERGRPSDTWLLVAADIALWLGEELVARSGGKSRPDVAPAVHACALAAARGDRTVSRTFVGLVSR